MDARARREPVRIGVIGCGRLLERGYVPAVQRVPDVTLAAVADPVADRCRQLAPTVAVFESVEALLNGCEVDAIVVATPPETHLAAARGSTRAGVPTLVEKPPALGVEDARELTALDPQPWIGFNRRFTHGLRERRKDLLERVVTLELELTYFRSDWRPHTAAPDALLDAGCHLVDLARWLSGAEIRRARSLALTAESGRVELDLGHVRARLEFAVDRSHRERVEGRDDKGRRVFRRVDGGALRALARRARSPSEDNPFVNSLARQLQELALELSGAGAGTLAGAEDGLRVMQALAAVRASAERGGEWENVST